MRKLLTLFVLALSFGMSAQEANSLLWEISGNGLQQSSYLYGTMHVSKRIAFRLDDVFYEALDQSEVIALESDPGTWLENSDLMGLRGYGMQNGFRAKGFYIRPFRVDNPRKEAMASYLAFDDSRVNGILYRSNGNSQDFEEETYLDMFIYQAGIKFGKPVVALEDLEESATLVGRASMNPMKKKPDEWLQKKMQQQDFMTLLQDAYRDRNINLLDSIDKGMYTEHYLENMLFKRNRNMAKRLDSVIRTTKTFTGIGAAHLPGKEGVIEMLRDMGYTVKPLISKSTQKGKRIKERLEKSIRENEYQTQRPDDDFFSISLHNKLYPVSEKPTTTYISPDLANGSYMMVNRIPTFAHLKQETVFGLEDLDQMLFENIPGTIMEKKRIERNGFPGLDVKNRLKNGDHQRYHIYVTPLEIVIFKMGGDGDYVTQHSDSIFNSISFLSNQKKSVTVSPEFDDFEVRVPGLYSFPNRSRNGDRTIQGYDSISDSYYFLRKSTLNDFNFIEQDTFELKHIQKRFYQDLELSPEYDDFNGKSLTSHAIIDSIGEKRLHLKTTFKGGEYYLLAAVTDKKGLADSYFESFKIKPTRYAKDFEKVIDTAMFFTTISPVRPPKFVENSNQYLNGRNRPKSYSPYTKKTIYQNRNNEAITVALNKGHDFMMFPDVDSVWTLRKEQYADKRFTILKEERSSGADGQYQLELILADTASTRGILIKNVLKGGLLYELKAQVDTVEIPSDFVSEFFGNFKVMDTVIGRDLLVDKTPEFFDALRKNDSIVLDGYPFIHFSEKHLDSLKHYIAEFEYPDDKKHIQAHLIQQLGRLQHPDVLPFLRSFYGRSYNNSEAQAKILQAVSCKSDEKSVALLKELLAEDLPLVSNGLDIHHIFRPYKDSLPLAKQLYPDLMDYSTIPEYKSSVFSMLARLRNKGLIKPKNYKKYRKQLLNDAKIQLKRELGNHYNQNENRYYAQLQKKGDNELEDYAMLLYPFRNEKDVKLFFDRLLQVKDRKIRTTHAMLMAREGNPMPEGILESLASDINSRALLFSKLRRIGRADLFPLEFRSERYLAESLLYESGHFDAEQDSIEFIDQRDIGYKGKQLTGYYFKTRSNDGYDSNFSMNLVVFEKGDALTAQPFYKKQGMRIEDTDTDLEAIAYITEEFLLQDRQRAEVYRPNSYNGYGFYGY
ncbi:TraB/GumN family protein [Flavobacteriaceae bacterium TP-CH-4]|uniref:TraB/GumN family protein n=1 Tax=Pelagihabitans pacificus TaxID=2696054 RepID=A0A967AUH4_9FLAO|nr:TraB/GumN family protein [Pelagihabitans pacificus]NHF60488.1 TraB/GumN family protein [Pelagihabitans pacificus]